MYHHPSDETTVTVEAPRVTCRVPGQILLDSSGKRFQQPTRSLTIYVGEPVEFQEHKKFEQHSKGWGAAHTGPAFAISRVVCNSDVIAARSRGPGEQGLLYSTFALQSMALRDLL